ncbi:mitochondrial thiamine pyrophosphate carrier-like [Mizuhopecten yessoensis]|uniref:Mitochondrial thiamine pyrophosphate carrier n=1 Tax=Mizuhopecten yessoensis TaxID=6573 RepID=A0A210QM37_MIZYE|nr:mitochondrial thiamine pyrophosphate carrier-like [Mizuhopecten yessoensis]XP_021354773.1 mitochondrial thiamine pyrophosphate carrier-like [Mizuhopecten yessoensis]XP_021354774.1 mitochondrial thiamine pyrophosphate carrier-like [Mizuhopecten yessoensis]XP_021354775.1 mitochondrial thiamine pyrophosphate carrier-like [Mizuhopecten yessoensis]XP_021354776.1 mitochondrial thiamine pyrophosphate carrier-like [Mizuhopecten yessoensis]XP_021354777.1 mitochondrial thiamine pyrophosphate carrier-
MVGYRAQEDVHLTGKEHALAGAVSGVVSRVMFQPLDVLKVRFQLQIEPIQQQNSSKYWGIYQATRTIIKEEGTRALWKGHVPAQLLSVVYGVGQFVTFEFLTKLVWKHLPEECSTKYRPLTHTVCGSLAACSATVLAHPADVLRTRFIAQGSIKTYSSLLSGIKKIKQTEGILGFYKGLGPALIQTGFQMGLQFGLYSGLTSIWQWMEHRPLGGKLGITESLVCGAGSGIISKLIAYPLDMTKKRLELQGVEQIRKEFGAIRVYRGFINCLVCVLREEGVRGMYKGLSPSLIKAGFMSASNFFLYDQVCNVLSRRNS